MNKPTIFVALMLAVVPMTGIAAGKTASASMQVSFTVVESCVVQGGSDRPTVQCQLDTPYLMQTRAAPAAATSVANPGSVADAPALTSAKVAEQPAVVYF